MLEKLVAFSNGFNCDQFDYENVITEILNVLGEFVGEYKGNQGRGQFLNMTGFAHVVVTNELKITDIKIFYNPEAFLKALQGDEDEISQKPYQGQTFDEWLKIQNFKVGDVITPTIIKSADEEIDSFNNKIDRNDVKDLNISWKNEKPNYSLVDLAYYKGNSKAHGLKSSESLVSNLIKRCEMEISYIKDKQQWKTFANKDLKMEVNGSDVTNLLNDFEKSSSKIFKEAFPWEVTEVFSQAPEIAFSWRHWSSESEKELKGFAVIEINENFEIENLKLFYKPEEIPDELFQEKEKCPFAVLKDA